METQELVCPACGFNYLHHYRVDVFERREDDDNTLHVTILGAADPFRVGTEPAPVPAEPGLGPPPAP